MKQRSKFLILLLIGIMMINLLAPVRSIMAAADRYGVILGDKDYNFSLYDNLVVKSPENNLMVRALSLCKGLGLFYSYNKATKELTISNPENGKSLVYKMGKKSYTYYPAEDAKGQVKTAAYKFYYDSKSKSNVIHMSTLKYIVNHSYYSKVKNVYYQAMGYKTLMVYSIHGYNSKDLPITDKVMDYVNAKHYTTAEELLDAVRLNMLARRALVTFQTTKGVMNKLQTTKTIYDLVIDIDKTETARDADYLSLLMKEFRQEWQSMSTVITYPNGSKEVVHKDEDPASLTIEVKYDTTLAQERAVDSRITEILKELKLTETTDYEKVKSIHDYIINLASYDTSKKKSSAYDLLINKSSVCEGYALAAYRLFKEAGLESRIISGRGNGENHAWNIVKVEGKWYNIDLTWDDPVSRTGEAILSYKYFLKNEKDFTDHERDEAFRTKEFKNAYPIAALSYQ